MPQSNHSSKSNRSHRAHVPNINKNSKRLITPKRSKNLSVNTALYKDAEVRRDSKAAEIKKSQSKERKQKTTLNTSKKMLVKRYLLEFDEIAVKLGIGEEPESSVHYTQFKSLLQHMGFVPEDNEFETYKITMIWNIIQDQNNEDTGNYWRKHSLKVILAAISGFDSKWMFKEYTKDQNFHTKAPKRSVIDLFSNETWPVKLDIGWFIEGLFFLNHQEEADYIQRMFSLFYNNRLLQKNRIKQKKREFEHSEQQASLYRPKINHSISKNSHNVPVEERLMSKHKEYQEKRKVKEIEHQIKKQKDCTFNPNLNKRSKNIKVDANEKSEKKDDEWISDSAYDKLIDRETRKRLKHNRVEMAAKTTKGNQLQLDLDKDEILRAPSDKSPQNRYKSTSDIEKERENLDYQEPIQHEFIEPQYQEVDNFEVYIEETNKDNNFDIHEEEKRITIEPNKQMTEDEQSGSDINEEHKESSPNFEDSPIRSDQEDGEGEGDHFPILFLDVNLGKDRVERLVIYEGDDPFSVADEFCAKYELEERKKKKLAKVIKKQLDTLLTRIDEDEDEEDSK